MGLGRVALVILQRGGIFLSQLGVVVRAWVDGFLLTQCGELTSEACGLMLATTGEKEGLGSTVGGRVGLRRLDRVGGATLAFAGLCMKTEVSEQPRWSGGLERTGSASHLWVDGRDGPVVGDRSVPLLVRLRRILGLETSVLYVVVLYVAVGAGDRVRP